MPWEDLIKTSHTGRKEGRQEGRKEEQRERKDKLEKPEVGETQKDRGNDIEQPGL